MSTNHYSSDEVCKDIDHVFHERWENEVREQNRLATVREQRTERLNRVIARAVIKFQAGRDLTADERADLDRKTRVEAVKGKLTVDNREHKEWWRE